MLRVGFRDPKPLQNTVNSCRVRFKSSPSKTREAGASKAWIQPFASASSGLLPSEFSSWFYRCCFKASCSKGLGLRFLFKVDFCLVPGGRTEFWNAFCFGLQTGLFYPGCFGLVRNGVFKINGVKLRAYLGEDFLGGSPRFKTFGFRGFRLLRASERPFQ